jgi:hypothetical protein
VSVRDILSAKSSTSRAITFDRWFADRKNKRAATFVAEWVAMRETYETDWSVARVLRHLNEKMACPLRSEVGFQRWLQRTYPTQYRRFIAR